LAIKLGENERSFANKLSRGAFTAAFMLQCLDAIGSRSLQLDWRLPYLSQGILKRKGPNLKVPKPLLRLTSQSLRCLCALSTPAQNKSPWIGGKSEPNKER